MRGGRRRYPRRDSAPTTDGRFSPVIGGWWAIIAEWIQLSQIVAVKAVDDRT